MQVFIVSSKYNAVTTECWSATIFCSMRTKLHSPKIKFQRAKVQASVQFLMVVYYAAGGDALLL